ncbi:hypothetical protein B0H63DRAFT_443010 [Podospora didyma]|uniref:Uncharacterized protein n=1 Tax=Podospora didyma TaxID=330526 RepID=A0AAE0P3M9_9PEZI|nr:hypothetical protein B0H63DRAFT_443010 [Podospora didyma]
MGVLFMEGGFVLAVYMHNLFGDAECLAIFLDLLAAEMGGSTTVQRGQHERKSRVLDLTTQKEPFDPLGASWNAQSGKDEHLKEQPTIAKIFVIDSGKLERDFAGYCDIAALGFTLCTLFALTWTYTSRARVNAYIEKPGPDFVDEAWHPREAPEFRNTVNWRTHWGATRVPDIFPAQTKEYLGNSVGLSITSLEIIGFEDMQDLFDALLIAKAIVMQCAETQSQDFVRSRTALFETISPDIRRIQPAFSPASHGLILPRRSGLEENELEMVIAMPPRAMELLLKDQSWMSLVSRVI